MNLRYPAGPRPFAWLPCGWVCPTTEWLEWSPQRCPSADSVQTRRRAVLVQGANYNPPALQPATRWLGDNWKDAMGRLPGCIPPALMEQRPCPSSQVVPSPPPPPPPPPPAPSPPRDCVLAPNWRPWGACSKECGGGTRRRERDILAYPNESGAPCGPTVETEPCNTQPCPVPEDCVASDFGPWSECSVPCGGGWQSQTRVPISGPNYGGRPCSQLYEMRRQRPCNPQPCNMTPACYELYKSRSACQAYEREKQQGTQGLPPGFMSRGRSACQSQLPAECKGAVPIYY
jgi:hypothetical protein